MERLSWLHRFLHRPKPFRAKTFARRERFRGDYRQIAHFLLHRLDFVSAYDVGCGNAFLLSEFVAAGKKCGGIELSSAVLEVIPPALGDLVEIGDFMASTGSWDLVCCTEVAEHVPPKRSRELVATLARLARRWIYFTAAPPGQSGRGHINCRPHEEWLAWFGTEGWSLDQDLTADLRSRLGNLQATPWLQGNSLLLRQERD